MELWADFLTHRGKLIHKWAHYFPIYERHFSRFRGQSIFLLEIGCGSGGSLQLWRRYFGPSVRIVGLDIRPECKAFEEHQIKVRIGPQADEAFLAAVIAEFGIPDIVIDDGSHMQSDINSSFNYLYPLVQANGVYLVEDLHTAYWPAYEGGLNSPQSFIEKCKTLVDELNGDSVPGGNLVTEFTSATTSMSFYDSIVVFEKGIKSPSVSLTSENGVVGPGFNN